MTNERILVVQILLNHSADADQADSRGETPLMAAAQSTRHVNDSVRIIKPSCWTNGAKRGLKNPKGHTALDLAKESKNVAAVELLK